MVVPHMSIEVVFPRIVLMALWEGTLERALPGVTWHVTGEIFVVDEALAALFALVWAIRATGMVSFVVSKKKGTGQLKRSQSRL
jgi:hypothetical protein